MYGVKIKPGEACFRLGKSEVGQLPIVRAIALILVAIWIWNWSLEMRGRVDLLPRVHGSGVEVVHLLDSVLSVVG